MNEGAMLYSVHLCLIILLSTYASFTTSLTQPAADTAKIMPDYSRTDRSLLKCNAKNADNKRNAATFFSSVIPGSTCCQKQNLGMEHLDYRLDALPVSQ